MADYGIFDIDEAIHAMRIARCDLAFALACPDLLLPEENCGRLRLEQSIRMLTKAIGDEKEFKQILLRWDWEEAEAEDKRRTQQIERVVDEFDFNDDEGHWTNHLG